MNDATCYSCGRRNPGLWGFAPLVRSLGQDLGFGPLVMGLCMVLYVLSLILSGNFSNPQGGGLAVLSPNDRGLRILGASGASPVFGFGWWWTIFSAGWLHGGILHIAMNLLWVRQLAPVVAYVFGPGRSIIIYVLAGACGFLLSSLAGLFLGWLPILPGPYLTVGASAPIFGMFGALVCYGRMGGSSLITGEIKTYALVIFLFGLVFPGVDNYAHAGGFVGGYALARWLNPFREERLDHLLGALVCILITLASIAWTVFSALRIISQGPA